MKTQRSFLLYLLASLLACSIVAGPVLADGPWDIDNGGGSEANGGGGFAPGTPTIGNSEQPSIDTGGDEEPNLTQIIDFYLWYYFGYNSQKVEVEVKTYRESESRFENANSRWVRR